MANPTTKDNAGAGAAVDEHDTETMARLYLAQGKLDEAAMIYRRLLARAANDSQQLQHLQELLTHTEAQQAAAGRAPDATVDRPARRDRDSATLAPQGAGQVRFAWAVTARGRAAAAAQLAGESGRLIVRLLAAAPAAGGPAVAPTVRDVALTDDAGEVVLEAPAGAFLRAAVGLRAANGSFAAIAHSELCVSPAPEPTPV